eukprot:5830756-Prymnesium_polylepis.1
MRRRAVGPRNWPRCAVGALGRTASSRGAAVCAAAARGRHETRVASSRAVLSARGVRLKVKVLRLHRRPQQRRGRRRRDRDRWRRRWRRRWRKRLASLRKVRDLARRWHPPRLGRLASAHLRGGRGERGGVRDARREPVRGPRLIEIGARRVVRALHHGRKGEVLAEDLELARRRSAVNVPMHRVRGTAPPRIFAARPAGRR